MCHLELLGGCCRHAGLCWLWGAAHGMDMVPLGCAWAGGARGMATEALCYGKQGVILQRQLIVSFLLPEQNTCQLLNVLLFIVSLIFVSRLRSVLLPAFANTC